MKGVGVVVGGEGWQNVQDRVQLWWEAESTVQVHGGTGFCSSPLPVVRITC